jgi:N-acetyl-anhydromuramyl-L-alanine amidase AmpD
MSPNPSQVLRAVKASGVRYKLVPGWNNPDYSASGVWDPVGVLEHHTAGKDSLGWVVNNQYRPIRACHFLIDRDGTVNVVYALKCYHAGLGGPTKVGNAVVPKNAGNSYLYGIEIESLGTSLDNSKFNGYTDAQVEATAKLTAALLNMLNVPTSAVLNHKDYAPGRKYDTLLPKEFWRRKVQKHRTKPAEYHYRQGREVYESKMRRGQKNSDSVWNLSLALHRQKLLTNPTVDYTPAVVRACKRYQKKHGWSGKDADGIAGPVTVTSLGLKWIGTK